MTHHNHLRSLTTSLRSRVRDYALDRYERDTHTAGLAPHAAAYPTTSMR